MLRQSIFRHQPSPAEPSQAKLSGAESSGIDKPALCSLSLYRPPLAACTGNVSEDWGFRLAGAEVPAREICRSGWERGVLLETVVSKMLTMDVGDEC